MTITVDLATSIAAVAGLLTVVGNFVLQVLQMRRSRENGRKIDENTALTKVTAAQVDAVHAATTSIVEATGAHPILKLPDQ